MGSAPEPRIVDALEEGWIEDLVTLFDAAWWARGRDAATTRAIVAGSDAIVGLVDRSERLVGFARALSDGVAKALVLDVIVADELRGRGFGARLVEALLAHPRVRAAEHVELYCLPALEPFYASHGFGAEVGGVRLLRRSLPAPGASG